MGHVHNSTSWKELSSLLNMRLVCRLQLVLFQNHMASGLKGPFRDTLSTVNIYIFLLGITSPQFLHSLDLYWHLLGFPWSLDTGPSKVIYCSVYSLKGSREARTEGPSDTPKAVIGLNYLHIHSGRAVSAMLLT